MVTTGIFMRDVLCFGEALIDFLHSGLESQPPLALPIFTQFPGGAPANAAVAVARLGGRSSFVGQVGADSFGDFLGNALKEYGVNTDNLFRHPSAKTALAFVMLDAEGDRSFSFYRDNSADVLFTESQIRAEWFANKPITHICSNTLTTPAIAAATKAFIKQASQSGGWISFDVNLRHNLWPNQSADRELVNELVHSAHIIKFSRDELDYLAADTSVENYLAKCFSANCKIIIVTNGGESIEYFVKPVEGTSSLTSNTIQPPKVNVVDTTAGGDAFVGGFLFALSCWQENQLPDAQVLKTMIEFATACGAHTVTRKGAFPALPNLDAALTSLTQQGIDTFSIKKILGIH